MQPEAANLRASDANPETRAAHEGMADGPVVPSMPSVPPLSKAIEEVSSTPDLRLPDEPSA